MSSPSITVSTCVVFLLAFLVLASCPPPSSAQTWTGFFNVTSCNASGCCCGTTVQLVQDVRSNSLNFSSYVVGACGAGYTPNTVARVQFPFPGLNFSFSSTADGDNQTWTLSADSSTISTVDYTNAACNTIAVRYVPSKAGRRSGGGAALWALTLLIAALLCTL